jgi:hypothetical protein
MLPFELWKMCILPDICREFDYKSAGRGNLVRDTISNKIFIDVPFGVVTQHGQIVSSIIENKKDTPTTPTKQNGYGYKTEQESRFHFWASDGLFFQRVLWAETSAVIALCARQLGLSSRRFTRSRLATLFPLTRIQACPVA